MKRRILLGTGDAGESHETLNVVRSFREAGDTVTVAAPARRRLHLVMHDFEPGGILTSSALHHVFNLPGAVDRIGAGNDLVGVGPGIRLPL